MSNFTIQGYANLENVNANNMDLFYATMSAQLSTFFPNIGGTQGSICNGIGNIVEKFGQTGTGNVFSFENGAIRFLDQKTNLTTDTSIKACYTLLSGSAVAITCPISITQYYVVAVLSFNAPTDPFTTSTSVVISPTAMTLAQIAAQPVPQLYNPLFAITTTDGTNYTIHLDSSCAFNYGYIIGNPFPDIIDSGGLVSITGASGLTVIGAATFKTFANFVDDGVSAIISINRTTNARPGGVFNITSEATVSGVVPGFSTLALLELTGLGANPTLGASYDSSERWYGVTFTPAEFDPLIHPKALAILGDTSHRQSFTVIDTGGHSWVLACVSTNGPFPGKTVIINGYCLAYSFPIGVSTTTIDLFAAGIVAGAASAGASAVISIDNPSKYNIFTTLHAFVNLGGLIFDVDVSVGDTVQLTFNVTFIN